MVRQAVRPTDQWTEFWRKSMSSDFGQSTGHFQRSECFLCHIETFCSIDTVKAWLLIRLTGFLLALHSSEIFIFFIRATTDYTFENIYHENTIRLDYANINTFRGWGRAGWKRLIINFLDNFLFSNFLCRPAVWHNSLLKLPENLTRINGMKNWDFKQMSKNPKGEKSCYNWLQLFMNNSLSLFRWLYGNLPHFEDQLWIFQSSIKS